MQRHGVTLPLSPTVRIFLVFLRILVQGPGITTCMWCATLYENGHVTCDKQRNQGWACILDREESWDGRWRTWWKVSKRISKRIFASTAYPHDVLGTNGSSVFLTINTRHQTHRLLETNTPGSFRILIIINKHSSGPSLVLYRWSEKLKTSLSSKSEDLRRANPIPYLAVSDRAALNHNTRRLGIEIFGLASIWNAKHTS